MLAIFLFDVQGAIVKYMGTRYPVEQLATFRNIFGLIPSLLVLWFSREWHDNGRQLAIRQWRFALLRGFYVAGAQFCFYLSLTKMELATATTLTFIGIPFSFALGWLFFDETPFEKLFPGVILIVAGGLLIAWRERKKHESLGKSLVE